MSSTTWRTPTQWELFAQNMSDDLDKLNQQLADILHVEAPVPPIPIEPFIPQMPSAPATERSHRFKRTGNRYTTSNDTRKFESNDQNRASYTQSAHNGNQSARIVKPRKPNLIPYPFPKEASRSPRLDTFVECGY